MNYLARLAILIIFLQSTVLNAGVLGITDDPAAWGSFPKHFVIGKTHPKNEFTQKFMSYDELKNLIALWNRDSDLGILVTQEPGCIFGDLGVGDCSGSYGGGWDEYNWVNEVYFSGWPVSPEFEDDLGLTRRRSNLTPVIQEADVFINPSEKWIRL